MVEGITNYVRKREDRTQNLADVLTSGQYALHRARKSAHPGRIDPREAIGTSIFAGLGLTLLALVSQNCMDNPLKGDQKQLSSTQESGSPKKNVLGFVRLQHMRDFFDFDKVDFDALTHIGVFGISVNGNGDLVINSKDAHTEEEADSVQSYNVLKQPLGKKLIRVAKEHNVKPLLTITQFYNEPLQEFLLDEAKQQKAIDQMIELSKEEGLEGVSIDFENMEIWGPRMRKGFVQFVRNLKDQYNKAIPGSKISVCIHPLAPRQQMLWDLEELSKIPDVSLEDMTYEYTTRNADRITATSPLNGHSQGLIWNDVSTSVAEALRVVSDPNKINLGIPAYNLAAVVREPKPFTPVVISPMQILTYAQSQNFLAENKNNSTIKKDYDPIGAADWIAIQRPDGLWRMMYSETSPRALRERLNFVKDKNLGGVAIWALDQMASGVTINKDYFDALKSISANVNASSNRR